MNEIAQILIKLSAQARGRRRPTVEAFRSARDMALLLADASLCRKALHAVVRLERVAGGANRKTEMAAATELCETVADEIEVDALMEDRPDSTRFVKTAWLMEFTNLMPGREESLIANNKIRKRRRGKFWLFCLPDILDHRPDIRLLDSTARASKPAAKPIPPGI